MSGRLVVVSNRLPLGDTPSGGLVVAMHEALASNGGIWIGTGDQPVAGRAEGLTEHPGMPYRRLTFDLSPEEHAAYYLGYANSVLWPLCHRRSDLMSLNAGDADGYRAVNQRAAQAIASVAQPDDLIWVQDYHFFPLARALRALGLSNRIGFFLHIPFPTVNDLSALTEGAELLDWLSAYDLVGLQANRDVTACREAFRALRDGHPALRDSGPAAIPSMPELLACPIGIDVDVIADEADRPDIVDRLRLACDDKLLIGVDRLDYSKGLVNKFQAFGLFLDRLEDPALRATLLQIAPPTREDVAAYQDIREQLEMVSGAVNGAQSDLGWTPIRYIHRAVPRERLAPLYRRAQAALVTPFADGMNLVAKEFVAAQDPEDPGVLILSYFAGAIEQLEDAIPVNPYDLSDMADAIQKALTLPLAERRTRHARNLQVIRDQNIGWWTDRFLSALRTPPTSCAA